MDKPDPSLTDVLNRLAIVSDELIDTDNQVHLFLAATSEVRNEPESNNNNHWTMRNWFQNLFRFLPTEKKNDIIRWFENTNALNKNELKRLTRLPLFCVNERGQLALRKTILHKNVAVGLLCFIFTLMGTWIGWILFGAKPDLQLIGNSTAAGIFLGQLIALILDFSFRHQHMYDKLGALAPNLLNQ